MKNFKQSLMAEMAVENRPPNLAGTETATKTNNRFLAPASWAKPRAFVGAVGPGRGEGIDGLVKSRKNATAENTSSWMPLLSQLIIRRRWNGYPVCRNGEGVEEVVHGRI